MRITNSAIQERLTSDLQRQFLALNRAAQQVSSGLRNQRISDDPVAGAAVLRADSALRGAAQYQRSVTSVRTRLDSEESTLDQVGDLLSRAKELATSQVGSTASAATRGIAAVEVDSLLKQAISLGNLRVGDEFVFGGVATNTPPFDAVGAYSGTATGRQAEIGQGVVINTVQSGQALFVDSGVISSLTALRDSLNANNTAGIQAALPTLDFAFSTTQSNLAVTGTRQNALDIAAQGLAAITTSLTTERAANADISIEEATLQFSSVQSALQAAYLATSKLMQLSLTNYLA